MNDTELRKAFEKYRTTVGRREVINALTGKGLSPSFAERAADGKWAPTRIHHRTRNAILEILGVKKAS